MQISRSRQRKSIFMFARNIEGDVVCTYVSRILASYLADQLAKQLPCIIHYLPQVARQLGRSSRLHNFLLITMLALFSGIQKSITFHSFCSITKVPPISNQSQPNNQTGTQNNAFRVLLQHHTIPDKATLLLNVHHIILQIIHYTAVFEHSSI